MAVDSDVVDVLDKLNKNIDRMFGGNTYGGGSSKKPTDTTDYSNLQRNVYRLSSTMGIAASSVQHMHLSADQAASKFAQVASNAGRHASTLSRAIGVTEDGMRRLTPIFAMIGTIGTIIGVAIHGLMDMSKTFSRMTDIGQNFGGSMFEMMRVSGEAGLSIEDFSKAIHKHSEVSAVLQRAYLGQTSSFTLLQKGVRDNLKDFGFYGMSLSEVTDSTLAFAETLRMSGQISKMTNAQLVASTTNFMKEVTGWSAATGKSRDEMIKSMTEFMKRPDVAVILGSMDERSRDWFTKVQGALSGAGQGGIALQDILVKMLAAEQAGQAPQSIPEVQKLIAMGLPDIAQQMADFVRRKDNSPVAIAKFMDHLDHSLFDPQNRSRINQLIARQDGSFEEFSRIFAGLHALMTSNGGWQGLTRKYQDALNTPFDAATQAALRFPETFARITGNIKNSFYKSLLTQLTRTTPETITRRVGETDEQLQKRRDESNAKYQKKVEEQEKYWSDLVGRLATNAGSFVGEILRWLTATNTEIESDSSLSEMQKKWLSFKNIFTSLESVLLGITDVFKKIGAVFTWANDNISNPIVDFVTKKFGLNGENNGLISTVLTGLLGYIGYRFLTSMFTLTIRNAAVSIGTAAGGMIGGRGGTTTAPGGSTTVVPGTATPSTAKGNALKTVIADTFGKGGFFRTFGGWFLSTLVGVGATIAIDKMIEDSPALKNSLPEWLKPVLAPIGGMAVAAILPMLVRGIAVMIVGAMTSATVVAALPAAIIVALGAAGFLAAKRVATRTMEAADKGKEMGMDLETVSTDEFGNIIEFRDKKSGKRYTPFDLEDMYKQWQQRGGTQPRQPANAAPNIDLMPNVPITEIKSRADMLAARVAEERARYDNDEREFAITPPQQRTEEQRTRLAEEAAQRDKDALELQRLQTILAARADERAVTGQNSSPLTITMPPGR